MSVRRPTMSVVASMDEIAWLRDNSPAWRLLRADNAPLVLSFLHRVFVADNVRSISAAELASRLDDELYALNQQDGDRGGLQVPQAGEGLPGRLGRTRGGLAAQVLPRRHRRAALRRHARGREGAAVAGQPARARVRGHRVAAEGDRRAAAADRLRHRARSRGTAGRAAPPAGRHRRADSPDRGGRAAHARRDRGARPLPAVRGHRTGAAGRLPRGGGELPQARPPAPGEDRRLARRQG